jgi:hypothetical protein
VLYTIQKFTFPHPLEDALNQLGPPWVRGTKKKIMLRFMELQAFTDLRPVLGESGFSVRRRVSELCP